MSRKPYVLPLALFALILGATIPAQATSQRLNGKQVPVDPNEGFEVYDPLAGTKRELEMDVPAHAERTYLVRIENYKRCEFDPYPIYDDDGNPTVSETKYTLVCREKFCVLDFSVPEDHNDPLVTYYEYDGKKCAPKTLDASKVGKIDGHYVIDIEVPLKLIPYKKNLGKYIRPEKSQFGTVTDFSTSKSLAYIKITYDGKLPETDVLEFDRGKVIMSLYKDRSDKGLDDIGATPGKAAAPVTTTPQASPAAEPAKTAQ